MKPNTPTCYSNHILIVCVYGRNEDRLNGYSGKHVGERRGRRGTKEDGKVPTAEKMPWESLLEENEKWGVRNMDGYHMLCEDTRTGDGKNQCFKNLT